MSTNVAPTSIELVEKVTSEFSHLALSSPLVESTQDQVAPYLVPPLPVFNAQDRFSRWTPIGTITPSAPAAGSLVVTISSAAYFSVPSIAEAVRTAHGFVGDFEVMITSSVPAGCSGAFWAAVHPQCGVTDILAANSAFREDYYFSCFQKSGCMISCAAASNAYLAVPYTSPKAYSLFTEPQAVFQFFCVAPPVVATDASAATTSFTVSMRAAPNFALVNPSIQSGATVPVLSYAKGASSVLRTTADAIDAVSKVVLNGKSVTPASGNSMRTFSSLPSFSIMDGVDVSQPLGPTSVSGMAESPTPVDLDSVASRWTWATTFDWSTTSLIGTVMGSMPVTPCNDFTFADPNPFLYPGPASAITLGFNYWRATSVYRIYLPASAFHRGVLQVAWLPGSTYAQGTRDPTNIAPNVLIEVEPGAVVDLVVGFAARTPYLNTLHTPAFQTNTAYDTYNSANGFLQFRVFTRLTCPTAVPLKVVVLQHHTDLEVAGPTQTVDTDFFNWPITAMRAQGGAVGDELTPVRRVVLVPPAPRLGAAMAGYSITSINAILQRMEMAHKISSVSTDIRGAYIDYGNSGAARTMVQYDHNLTPTTGPGKLPSTAMTYSDFLLSMFCGWRGSKRFAMGLRGFTGAFINIAQTDYLTPSLPIEYTDVGPLDTGLIVPCGENDTEVVYFSAPLAIPSMYEFSGALKTTSVSEALPIVLFFGEADVGSPSYIVWSAYSADVSPVLFRNTTRWQLFKTIRFPKA